MNARRGILSLLFPLLSLALPIAVLTGGVLRQGDRDWLVRIEAKEDVRTDFLISSGIRIVKDMGTALLAAADEEDVAKLTATSWTSIS